LAASTRAMPVGTSRRTARLARPDTIRTALLRRGSRACLTLRGMFARALALFALVAAARPARAGEEWNRFRGPSGAGVASSSMRLPDVLDPAKNLLWSAEL